jgi:hypothetical protein
MRRIAAADRCAGRDAGGTGTIATYSLDGNQALGCSVDPTTGSIAVVYRGDGADIAVFPNGGGTPALYDSHLDSSYCGYDGNGNLFVNGYNGQQYGLSELPTGSSEFTRLSINGSLGEPREVQWDGTYITWESGGGPGGYAVSRLQISRLVLQRSSEQPVSISVTMRRSRGFSVTGLSSRTKAMGGA